MSTFKNIFKAYGWRGLMVYFQIKSGNATTIALPGIRNPIHLRRDTDDTKLFKQMLVHKEYEFTSPIDAEFIIDAGANIGLSSIFFAGKFPRATIAAIEPENGNYGTLCQNTRNYPNIKPLNAGLWFKTTTLEVIDSAVGTTGFMVRETTPDNPNGFKAVSAQDLLSMYNKVYIDIFKIDVEGAEKEILAEDPSWLSVTKIIIIELHDRKKPGCSQAFFNAFRDRNFECHPFGQNFLMFNRDLVT